MKFFIKDFFSKCYQNHSFLRIWSHLLKKFLTENLIFLCSDRGINKGLTQQMLITKSFCGKQWIFYWSIRFFISICGMNCSNLTHNTIKYLKFFLPPSKYKQGKFFICYLKNKRSLTKYSFFNAPHSKKSNVQDFYWGRMVENLFFSIIFWKTKSVLVNLRG